ncbi:NEAT domain-containing protein [Ornithinibacillus halotolerans]|uniref:NEAT domain-containing protein n=1 Tax=Ornithinibacillus halotolerans TaxID=1274357 RepID=A0A916RZD4_9BACI|nr:NEAT domain-containing protein [Ornithinibacillus halotolerans]GGA74403.1 hypothetical protein GCM10008025_17680 [Ornithinibacillus halotolerans]
MRNSIKLMLALIIAIFTLPVFGGSVFAADENTGNELSYVILKGDENSSSSSARYFPSASVTEENGTKTVNLDFSGANYITALSIQGLESNVERNEDGKTGVLTFNVGSELPEVLYLDMTIGTPMGSMDHTVRLFLNVESIDEISEELLNATILKDEIGFVILKGDENADSSAARYFAKPALVTKETDGSKTVEINFSGANYITALGIQGLDSNVERNEDGKTGTLLFNVGSELPEVLYLDMTISTPMGSMDHTVRLFLNVESIDDIAEELLDSSLIIEEPVEEPVEEPKEEPKEEETAQDKVYEIGFDVLKEVGNENSVADQYFVKPAVLFTKDGVQYLQLKVNNWNLIDSLKTSDGEVEVVKENSDGSVVVEFKLNGELTDEIMLEMHITVPGMYSASHTARLVLDTDSKVEVSSEKVVTEVNDGEKVTETEKPNKESQENKNNQDKSSNDKSNHQVQDKKDQLTPDKVYEINYLVKHATQDKASAADQFFKKPAYLLVKNGEKYIQLTVTNSDMIDSLRTAHGDVVIVKKNADGSMVIQFKVTDLSKPVVMDMHITVPGMYSMDHSARLFFDESNMIEIDSENHKIAASTDGSGNGKTVNPQTGDDTNILLYVLLLIGSAIPLAFFAKRRFA